MPKLPGIHHKDAIRVLEKLGWRVIREGKHTIMGRGTDACPSRVTSRQCFHDGQYRQSCGTDAGTVPGAAVTPGDFEFFTLAG